MRLFCGETWRVRRPLVDHATQGCRTTNRSSTRRIRQGVARSRFCLGRTTDQRMEPKTPRISTSPISHSGRRTPAGSRWGSIQLFRVTPAESIADGALAQHRGSPGWRLRRGRQPTERQPRSSTTQRFRAGRLDRRGDAYQRASAGTCSTASSSSASGPTLTSDRGRTVSMGYRRLLAVGLLSEQPSWRLSTGRASGSGTKRPIGSTSSLRPGRLANGQRSRARRSQPDGRVALWGADRAGHEPICESTSRT